MLFLTVVSAFAKCAAPQGGFSAQDILPTNPTLFYFQTGSSPDAPAFTATDATGKTLKVDARRLASPDGFVSWRVDVQTLDHSAIEVQASVGTRTPIVHQAEITHRAPFNPGAPIVTDVGESLDRWTCSHTETRDLDIRAPRAAAFRLEWTGAGGTSQQVVLPDHPGRLNGQPTEGRQRLELGYLNCLGESFSWTQDEIVATVTMLLANGAESPASAPLKLKRPTPQSPG